MTTPSQRLSIGRLYWVIVVALLVFGLLAIFTIGAAFLVLGVTLIILSPFRSKPSIFWPGLALVVGFLVGYALVAPSSCSQSTEFRPATGQNVTSQVVCRSLIGVEYSGPTRFQPTRTPGVVAGGVIAVLAAIGAWVKVRGRAGSMRSLTRPTDT